MNKYINQLQPYPFEKLTALKGEVSCNTTLPHISLSIGEPKHKAPEFVVKTLSDNLAALTQYPMTKGLIELREAIAQWATQRFDLRPESLTAEKHILPVAGTREALFSFTQACVNASTTAKVLMPNPFYQIYEGAAILAGAIPHFLDCIEKNNYAPDFDAVSEVVWHDCQLLFLCSPGNPTGTVLSIETLQKVIKLADKYDFIIASDECYSELYFDEDNPPTGLLKACAKMDRHHFERCIVFHSLSKRSNLPGLRSGFVAGDETIIEKYLLFRTYEGCALPVPTQIASTVAWQDETHVLDNRNLYREKFSAVINILKDTLPVIMPDAGFYLWIKTPIPDTEFAQRLYAEQNVTVLPGQFLGRETENGNPGSFRVRIALVANINECIDAAKRIKKFALSL
jgi:N-succinyldiaminopimelate aminotransferase